MTVLHWISAIIALIIIAAATALFRLGLFPVSVSPLIVLLAIGSTVLLGFALWLAMSDGRESEPMKESVQRVIESMRRDQTPIPEIARATRLPQDLIRGILGEPSDVRSRSRAIG